MDEARSGPGLTLRTRLSQVLTTWPFAASLLLLLLNDFWLKYAFPGLVTGKLSDVVGIGIVTMLLLAACPRRRLLIYALITGAFAFWKSPYSQPLIGAMNAYLPLGSARTVDYTDLLALAVMPVYAMIGYRADAYRIPGRVVRRLLLPPVAIATAFGLMATSMPQTLKQYQVRQLDPAAELNRTVMAAAVAEVAADFNLVCRDCVNPLEQARYDGKSLYLSYSYPDNRTIVFEFVAYPDGIYLGDTGRKKASKLAAALQKRFSRVYTQLEYSESRAGRRF
jgi:hypothetical protein